MPERVQKQALLVEFVGASGVGKSFVASRVHAALSKRGLPVEDFHLIKIKRTLRNFLTAAKAALVALRLRPKSFSAYMDSAERLARHRIRHDICGGNNRIYICDEGIFHKIRKLYRSSRSLGMTQIADLVFTYMDIPDVVVVVEASAEEIFARRSRRKRTGDTFSQTSVRDDVRLLEDSTVTVKHTQQSAPDRLQVIRIDAVGGDVQPVVERLADCLENRFRNSSPFPKEIDLRPPSMQADNVGT